jgi:hypothetical protein
MRVKVVLFCFLFCLVNTVNCTDFVHQNENRILEMARRKNLPVVAVFVSKEGCPWSKKLVQEVLKSPWFIEKLSAEAILWETALGACREDLVIREKYNVGETPLFLLLDPGGKEFARVSYAPLDAASYAGEILGLIDSFHEVCTALEREECSFHEEKWKDLYLKAKRFSVPCFRQKLLERGFKKEKGVFFHLEKYASFLGERKSKDPDVLQMKKNLLGRDPYNRLGTPFQIAAIEFQNASRSLKPDERFEKALKPLFNYVRTFKEDLENLWKAELMIAEYFYSKNRIDAAIAHVEASINAAPENVRPHLEETLSCMKKKQTQSD